MLLAACFLLVTYLAYSSTLKMEVACSSKTTQCRVTLQKTVLLIHTTMRTSNAMKYSFELCVEHANINLKEDDEFLS
jgi:hypothetical protein